MNQLRSKLALAAFLAELGEAVEQAELVRNLSIHFPKPSHYQLKIISSRTLL